MIKIACLLLVVNLLSPDAVLSQEHACGFNVPQEGRNEPQYINLIGYLIPGEFYSPPDSHKKLPDYPWSIHPLEQVGPHLYDYSKAEIPAKTKVRVLKQYLKHEGWGRYSGLLLIETVADSIQYHIDVDCFCPVAYWECTPYEAVDYSPFIGKIKEGAKPVDRKGRWIEIGDSRIVFCKARSPERYVSEGVECLYYGLGKQATRIIVASEDLEIVY